MEINENDFQQMQDCIANALIDSETPLEEHHVKETVKATFKNQGGINFWIIVLGHPIMQNRLTALKFCHLVHKVLRDGHNLCLSVAMKKSPFLKELGNEWGQINIEIGLIIHQYTKVLIIKSKFHDKNKGFPGNLLLSTEIFQNICGDNVNHLLQLILQVFDYLDALIGLQSTIYHCIENHQIDPMSDYGHCHLAPIVPCIQESNSLYDFAVRMMYKLHTYMEHEKLIVLRFRFYSIFVQLTVVYKKSSDYPYFVDLITIPVLPSTDPDFQSDRGISCYIPPIVVIKESDDSSETDTNIEDNDERNKLLEKIDNFEQDKIIAEKTIADIKELLTKTQEENAHLIRQIKGSNKLLEEKIEENKQLLEDKTIESNHQLEQTIQEYERKMEIVKQESTNSKTAFTIEMTKTIALLKMENNRYNAQILELNKQIQTIYKNSELEKEEYLNKITELETVVKNLEENRLKTTDILENSKIELATLKCRLNEISNEKHENQMQFDIKVANYENEMEKIKARLQETTEELEIFSIELKTKCEQNIILENDQNRQVLQISELTKHIQTLSENYEEEKSEFINQILRLESRYKELEDNWSDTKNTLEIKNQDLVDLDQSFSNLTIVYQQIKTHLKTETEKYQDEKKQLIKKIEELELNVYESMENYKLNNAKYLSEINELKQDKNIKKNEIINLNLNLKLKCDEIDKLKSEVYQLGETFSYDTQKLKQEIMSITVQLRSKNEAFERLLLEKTELQQLLLQAEKENVNILQKSILSENISKEILAACIGESETMLKQIINFNANEIQNTLQETSNYFTATVENLKQILMELNTTFENCSKTNSNSKIGAIKTMQMSHSATLAYIIGLNLCNSLADIRSGENISEKLKLWIKTILSLIYSIQNNDFNSQSLRIKAIITEITELTFAINESPTKHDPKDQLGDLIESELITMDKSIDEASKKIEEMMAISRESNTGIKLEINEKILDSCTNLMNTIRILIQKSRTLQAEIVKSRRGSSTDTEFYKKNHQWTEGMISAAKNVAQGANYLVNAANKSVSGEINHQFDLIVAAQEIAASTAQLVVASRVKAERGSQNLNKLNEASKQVTHATAVVVAVARDSNKAIDHADLDFSHLTLHQSKTIGMEMQVKILELEQSLQDERERLSVFRKTHYQQ